LDGSGGAIYSWTPATYLSSVTVSNPIYKATKTITYELTVTDATGKCKSDPAYVTVYVVKPITVPNVITVNGDGVNDTWEIENIHGYPHSIIEIYNRWGNLVWKAEGYPKNWDGSNFRTGEVLPDGTYFYIIHLHSDVYPEPHTGWVQIIK
jgi:gliding motility-associated-like protein